MGFLKVTTVVVVVVAIALGFLLVPTPELVGKPSRTHVTFTSNNNNETVLLERTEDGIMQAWVKDWKQFFKTLGYLHIKDRAVQMFLYRSISQGRLSETFASDESTLKIDTFMRRLGIHHYAKKLLNSDFQVDSDIRELLNAYTEGVNQYLHENNSLPLELKLVGYHPEPWTPEDSICIAKLISYVGLADTQQNAEKVIIQSIQDSPEAWQLLQLMLAPHLDNVDKKTLDIIKQVRIEEEIIPASDIPIPKLRASNNWAVSPKKSKTNFSLFASDPHLNVMQLPPVWYECIAYVADTDNYVFGITLPGAPAFLMGRTKYISWGFTYGFMDIIDYFIEHCKGDTCRRDEQFVPVTKRYETIKRKGSSPIDILVYETVHGVLEVKNITEKGLEEGYYLSRAISTLEFGSHDAMKASTGLLEAKNVKQAMQEVCINDISTNMIIVDKENIGYQQTGYLPKRTHSGIGPVPGWDLSYDWKGRVPCEGLTSIYNPESGFLATANNMIDPLPGNPQAISLEMGSYRVDRINELLSSREKHSVVDLMEMQGDLFSTQAARFMHILKPLLPKDDQIAVLLANWDLQYTVESREAVLFEAFYEALLSDVFAKVWKNPNAWHMVISKGFGAFFHFFDDVILEYSPKFENLLWKGEKQDELFSRIIRGVLANRNVNSLITWGDLRKGKMTNMLFGGKLGSIGTWLGIDYEISLPGSRSTIFQGQKWVENGLTMSFAPSWRFTTDMATHEVHSILPGGPSANPFSGLYTSEVNRWLLNKHKKTILKAT